MHHSLLALLLMTAMSAADAREVELTHEGLTLNANLVEAGESWPKGPVVLMTHGTLAHGGMEIMAALQVALGERGISSLAPTLSLGLDDRHGMYDCKVAHTHKHTDALDEIGAWLQWLKQQGAERLVLLGHSRGGNQTAWFAAERPDSSVAGVVLVAPQTWSAAADAADYQKRYGVPLRPELEKAQRLVADGKGGALLEKVDFIYCEDASVAADAFVGYYAPNKDMDTPNLIPRIQARVLVVGGSEDGGVKTLVEKTEPLVDGERVQLVVLDGADHFFRDLYAEDIADALEGLLAQ